MRSTVGSRSSFVSNHHPCQLGAMHLSVELQGDFQVQVLTLYPVAEFNHLRPSGSSDWCCVSDVPNDDVETPTSARLNGSQNIMPTEKSPCLIERMQEEHEDRRDDTGHDKSQHV